ncbi:hypothetical protein [Herbaspirillum robiniae]|uniref:hypothetical protein n=1 Tax=Herbaspirillum robiniae TaxID=2014887 RepID=UPI003D776AC5
MSAHKIAAFALAAALLSAHAHVRADIEVGQGMPAATVRSDVLPGSGHSWSVGLNRPGR